MVARTPEEAAAEQKRRQQRRDAASAVEAVLEGSDDAGGCKCTSLVPSRVREVWPASCAADYAAFRATPPSQIGPVELSPLTFLQEFLLTRSISCL